MAAYYCFQCLRKPKKHQLKVSKICPRCDCELRPVKNAKTRAQVVTRLARKRGIKPPSRKSDYHKYYLTSPEWKVIRGRVLARDENRCRMCGGKAEVVHHLSYTPDVMAGKNDEELISACKPCHKLIHNK